MTEQTKKSTYTHNAKLPAQNNHHIPSATHKTYLKPPTQPSRTPPSLNPPKNFSSDMFVPSARSWDQPCQNTLTPTAMEQMHNNSTTMSRWVAEPQRKQPWNAIGSIPARPFGPGTTKNVAKEKKDQKKDTERATGGSASTRAKDDAL